MKAKRIFVVDEDSKCGCCNWETRTAYLFASSQEEAKKLFEENERGLCGDCMVSLLRDLMKERKLILLSTSGDEDWKDKLPKEIINQMAVEEL